jgi:hypothetical protein
MRDLKKKAVFLCVYPDPKGAVPKYVTELEARNLTVLHPNFDWENENGKAVRQSLALEANLPWVDNIWSRMVLRDAFTVAASDLVVYDVDLDIGTDFLFLATLHHKPILAVAENLTAPPLRYSGFISKVVRPDSLLRELVYWDQ